MSNQAKRYEPTKRAAIRTAINAREFAADVARYRRNGVAR